MDVRTAPVLGASGGTGGETARSLARHGRHVRALSRNARRDSSVDDGFAWVAHHAMTRDTVPAACIRHLDLVHLVNPLDHRNRPNLSCQGLDTMIAAAHAADARILLAGMTHNQGITEPFA